MDENGMFKMVAKTLSGLDQVLARELRALGAKKVRPMRRSVEFEGDLSLLYKANYYCRTALSIHKPIAEFPVSDEKSLYHKAREVAWDEHLKANRTFTVTGIVNNSNIKDAKFAEMKTKDAIRDYFKAEKGRTPKWDAKAPDVQVLVHVFNGMCTILLNSSGSPLYKRGYRKGTGKGPTNEVLAAGLIAMSGWKADRPLVDPMCGSGTLLLEAAMIASNTPAGKYREHFDFFNWRGFHKDLWESIVEEAEEQIKPITVKLYGADISPMAIRTARGNLIEAGFEDRVRLAIMPVKDFNPELSNALVISNTPPDNKLKPNELKQLYTEIGSCMRSHFSQGEAWLFSTTPEGQKHIGIKPTRKFRVSNGPLDCHYIKYDLLKNTSSNK